ncbi:MAG: hypothetical protein RR135_04115, partial [Oscillospiraceae bacterium]
VAYGASGSDVAPAVGGAAATCSLSTEITGFDVRARGGVSGETLYLDSSAVRVTKIASYAAPDDAVPAQWTLSCRGNESPYSVVFAFPAVPHAVRYTVTCGSITATDGGSASGDTVTITVQSDVPVAEDAIFSVTVESAMVNHTLYLASSDVARPFA